MVVVVVEDVRVSDVVVVVVLVNVLVVVVVVLIVLVNVVVVLVTVLVVVAEVVVVDEHPTPTRKQHQFCCCGDHASLHWSLNAMQSKVVSFVVAVVVDAALEVVAGVDEVIVLVIVVVEVTVLVIVVVEVHPIPTRAQHHFCRC